MPFSKGQSGNPKGRPKGVISLKDKIRQRLEKNPKIVEKLVDYFIEKNPDLMWQMLEGRPPQDVTSGGNQINISITPSEAKRFNIKETTDGINKKTTGGTGE